MSFLDNFESWLGNLSIPFQLVFLILVIMPIVFFITLLFIKIVDKLYGLFENDRGKNKKVEKSEKQNAKT